MEAVFDSAKELRTFERPVIIMLTDTHAEYSSLPAHHVMDELQRSGAMLQVIAVARVAPLNPSSVPLAKDKPSDLLATELRHQYLITYLVPAGEKLGQRLNVSVKRRGVTVRAPARARGNP